MDSDGLVVPQILGGLIGAVAGSYAALASGASVEDALKSAAVGFAAGVLSTIPIPGINPLLSGTALSATAGFFGNLIGQWATGTHLACLDYKSAALSGLAGGIGGFLGAGSALAAKGGLLGSIFGSQAVGAVVGGASATVVDVILH